MTPDVVVDIGNSRMKWGLCKDGRVAEMASLPLGDPDAWTSQAGAWRMIPRVLWTVASVNPPVDRRFEEWATDRGGRVFNLDQLRDVPLNMAVDRPEQVGFDRVLAALAAHSLSHPDPAVVISIGTAATVDLVDAMGVFQGGVIIPGPRLMAESLHAQTAKLPLVDAAILPRVIAPGKNTGDAILAGIRSAIVGATVLLANHYADHAPSPWVFVTGGAAGDLGQLHFGKRFKGTRFVPTLTLDGIRIAAEALP